MPIHDVGYRPWNGTPTPESRRWWIITMTGLRLAAKSRWIRRIMLAAWLPLLYWGGGFFAVEKWIAEFTDPDSNIKVLSQEDFVDVENLDDLEQIAELTADQAANKALKKGLRQRLEAFPQSNKLIAALDTNDRQVIRREVWRWLLMVFFRYPQSVLIVFLVGSVAPGLIASDIRSRAFLLYFSKPIGRLEYIFGKLMIPAIFITAVCTLPALALYLFAVLMSPDFSVLWATWDIPIRILAATATLVIPTASLALMLSSLTQESRFATFAWFAVWVLGHGSYLAVLLATSIRKQSEPFSQAVMDDPLVEGGSVLSLYNCLGDVQVAIFGFASFSEVWLSFLVIIAITVISWLMLYRRVSSPIRV